MTTICEICGKNLKNTQGLRGHKQFVHNQITKKNTGAAPEQLVGKLELTASDTPPTTDQHNSKLEERLQELEQVSDELSDLLDYNTTSLTDITRQLAEQAQQQKELVQQIRKFDEDLKSAETVSWERLARFTQQVGTLDEVNKKLSALVNSNVEKLKSDIDNIKFRMLRNPTGNVVSLCVSDGQDGQGYRFKSHRFKEYRGSKGLMQPSKTKPDRALGDRYVDLSEPED